MRGRACPPPPPPSPAARQKSPRRYTLRHTPLFTAASGSADAMRPGRFGWGKGAAKTAPTATSRTGRRSLLGSSNHRSPSRVRGARVSFRMIGSRCEAHRSIARAKPVLGGRVRAGGGKPGAGRGARATSLFNDVQMAISQLLAARGAARRRRRRQSVSGPRTWAGWPGPDPARGSEPSGPPGGAPGASYTP